MSEQAIEAKPVTTEGQAEAAEREVKLQAAKEKVEAAANAIAEDCAKQEGAAGQKFLRFGEKCVKFHKQAEAAGYTKKDARGMLESAILLATRVDWSDEITRAIKVYHVHACLGEGVLSLPLDMVKALAGFVQEDQQTGEWGLKPKYEDAVKKLYHKVVNGKGKRMLAKDFRAELNRIANPSGDGASTRTSNRSVSPAGETGRDLGRPPIDTPTGSKINPGNTALTVIKAIEGSEDETASAKIVGQKIDADLLLSMFDGFAEKLLQSDDRVQAAADFKYAWTELQPILNKLHAAFPAAQKKAG